MDVQVIKQELSLNEANLYQALLASNMLEVLQLMQQRANLKDLLIEALELELIRKVG